MNVHEPLNGCYFRPLAAPRTSMTWEITNRCRLACVHCCTKAQQSGFSDELSEDRVRHGIDFFCAEKNLGEIYFSGGEPLEREGFFRICEYAAGKGLRLSSSTSGLPVDDEAAKRIAGLPFDFMNVSLDFADAAEHDAWRGRPGVFDMALRAMDAFARHGVRVHVSSVVSKMNQDSLERLAALCAEHGAASWTVGILLPVGRAMAPAVAKLVIPFDELESMQQRIASIGAAHEKAMSLDMRRSQLLPPGPLAACPGGVRLFHVDARGTVWPCSWAAKALPGCAFGSVAEGGPVREDKLDAFFSFLSGRKKVAACARCPVAEACAAGCPVAEVLGNAAIGQPDPYCRMAGLRPEGR